MTSRISGEIPNLFSESEMDQLVEFLSLLDPIVVSDNVCKGVSQDHFMYEWFDAVCFSRVKQHLGQESKLVFGMYLEENQMWGIHTDSYHCDGFSDRESHYSMIIPYSVDRKKELVDQASTIIFNETSEDYIIDRSDTRRWSVELLKRPTPVDNASQYFESHLSHNDPKIVEKLTLRNIHQWSLGSMIYWESTLLHDSNNFKKNGHHSKEAIVIHTYKSPV